MPSRFFSFFPGQQGNALRTSRRQRTQMAIRGCVSEVKWSMGHTTWAGRTFGRRCELANPISICRVYLVDAALTRESHVDARMQVKVDAGQ
jgi:hypothetical protein